MAAAHESVLFDVYDVKVYPLTVDNTASPTYGAGVDVYGAAEVSLDPNFVSAELKGDSRIIAKRGKIDRLNAAVTYGRLSADVLAVVAGTTTTDVSASQARSRLLAGVPLPYFKMAFRIADTDNGLEDVIVTLYKCLMTGGSIMGSSSDNFGQPSIEVECIGLASSAANFVDLIADIDFYNVVTPLP